MSDYLDLTSYGYQIETELGRNREGGRITWKAVEIETKTTVVIKQFRFAQPTSSWSGYKAYGQEMALLQKLKHPSIPHYLHSIETNDGFCLIQEYIEAIACNIFRPLTTEEVKGVAAKILDILIYLQQQTPPVLHRDISTDNILLDESLNVYLIDFGFSSLGSKEVSTSSIFQGTPGFIAPEQIIRPTMASDIYALGVTLTCLLSHQDIAEVRMATLVDDPYQLNLEQLLPDLDTQLLNWLKKMTNAKVSQRFANALLAKNALIKIDASDLVAENSPAINNWGQKQNLKAAIAGGVGIFGTTAIATWGVNFIYNQIELTFVTVGIAIIATIAIAMTQIGGATIARVDKLATGQGIILGVIMPMVLVGASGIIWQLEEAVIISSAIAIVEILLLSYYWLQLSFRQPQNLIKSGSWLSIVAMGIALGLKLFNY